MSGPIRLSSGEVVACSYRTARSRRERMRGLIGGPVLGPGEALVIFGAAQVHTFGIGHPIDVAFCERDGTVLHVVTDLKPRRVTRWVRGAGYALELEGGRLPGAVVVGAKLASLPR